jgi:hypothetical protein
MPAVRRRTRAAPGAEAKANSDSEAKLAALVEELDLEGASARPARGCSGARGSGDAHTAPAGAALRAWCGARAQASGSLGLGAGVTVVTVCAVESKCQSLQSDAERMASFVRYAALRALLLLIAVTAPLSLPLRRPARRRGR